jgi:flagellin
MPLGVLNNISAVYAENNLNQTQSGLQKVLTELSSGSKINSGADDPAGLSIANGLAANSAALSQSSSNASEGAGFLQVADGALSQVTSLLTSAVTLATEAGGGTLSGSQLGAANQEYQDILTQIGTIGSTTEYNGITVFSADQTTSALGWGANAVGSASSATATSGAIASQAITASAAAAPVQATTYGAATAMSWTLNGTASITASTSTITSSVIPNGAQLSGTVAFTPLTSGGTANPISINLANVTGSSLGTQATSLANLINAQAGNGNPDYAVSVVNGNQLQIGLGTSANADHITGFNAAPATNVVTSGAAAAQTGFTMTVTDGGTLGGSLTVNPAVLVAGTQTGVNFNTSSSTQIVASNILAGQTLGGSITLGGTTLTPGTPSPINFTNSSGTYTATIPVGDILAGGFTITPTGGSDSPVDIDLTGLTTSGTSLVDGINSQLGSAASDYVVSYSGNTLSIGITASASGTKPTSIVVAADTSGGAHGAGTQTTAAVPGTATPKTIDLTNVTTANLQSTLNADLAGSDYAATYDTTAHTLTFSISGGQGASDHVNAINLNGVTPTVTKQTAASTSAGTQGNISLTNVTTANLASVVNTALNGVKTTTADYSVNYSGGVLTVGLTAYGTGTDNIGSLALTGSPTETSPTAASIQFTDGAQLSGQFSITPTISGAAGSITTVNLNGHSTSDLVSTVNAALGASASKYTVAYNASSGVGTLSISVNAAGLAANYDSVAIANGTSTNAMGQSGVAITNVNAANTVMGNFTVTSAGAGTAKNVDLDGVSNANLLSTVQQALGTNYTVSYNTTAATQALGLGNLSIGISAAGAAAGITSFTVAEASSQAASQETPITGGVSVYTSDGTSAGSQNYNVTVGALTDGSVGTSSAASATSLMGTQVTTTVGGVTGTGGMLSGAGAGTSLTGTNLNNQANAEAALQTIDNAINAVAYQRGQVGANINTLTAASNIASSQMTNITSAQNTITATDYASATSNMSKYEILTQTGISALAQANSTQQMVTKLLQ